MKREESLKKLSYLIKELSDTHNRLQEAEASMQEIEAALLNQQVITMYGHMQALIPSLRNDQALESPSVNKKQTNLQETLQVSRPAPVSSERKKALLREALINKNAATPESDNDEKKDIQPQVPEIKMQETPQDKGDDQNQPAYKDEIKESDNRIIEEAPKKTPASVKKITPELSLHEKLGIQAEPSLNERFATSQTKQNLADKFKLIPIKDLKSAIGLNQRITFINALFKGSDRDYKNAISTINNFSNYSEARTYINSDLAPKLYWDEENSTVQEFLELVQRRFL